MRATWTPPGFVGSLYGTADGFAYTVEGFSGQSDSTTILYHVQTFDGIDGGQPIFITESDFPPRLVWLRDTRMSDSPFLTWARPDDVSIEPVDVSIPEWQAWLYETDGRAVLLDQNGRLRDTVELVRQKILEMTRLKPCPRISAVRMMAFIWRMSIRN